MLETLVRYTDIKIDIDKSAEHILDTLMNEGLEAYLIGGCVRDSIINAKYKLGLKINDWDICTEARPEVIFSIFNKKGFQVRATGLKHDTVTVIGRNGVGYEVTTFKTDGATECNRASLGMGLASELLVDLSKRDFTLNSMAYNKQQGLITVSSSMQDIQNKIIKCVGDPHRRFKEDPMRIMRALRFASTLGYKIDTHTKETMIEMRHSLSSTNNEMKGRELCKLLLGGNKFEVLQECKDVIFEIIPELKPLEGLVGLNKNHKDDAYNHTIAVTSSLTDCKDIKVLLALFLHDIAKPDTFVPGSEDKGHYYGRAGFGAVKAKEILSRMNLSNEIIHDVCELITYHDTKFTDSTSIKLALSKIGHSQFQRLLLFKRADNLGKNQYETKECLVKLDKIEDTYREIISDGQAFSLKDLDITGKDLINIGYATGIRIGAMLNKLLELVIREDILNSKEELIRYAKEQLKELNK